MNLSTLCLFQTKLLISHSFFFFFFFSFVKFIYFFSPDGYSEDGCHVDTAKSNSEETVCRCNHLTYFAVLVDFDSGRTKVIFFLIIYIFLTYFHRWVHWSIFLLPISDTALQEGRNDPGDYHVRRVKSFHHRDAFDNRLLFFLHVSTVAKQSLMTLNLIS